MAHTRQSLFQVKVSTFRYCCHFSFIISKKKKILRVGRHREQGQPHKISTIENREKNGRIREKKKLFVFLPLKKFPRHLLRNEGQIVKH